MKPRYSIIVPLYNKAPYVKRALESIVSQTFTDWECIIVDDGSTDESIKVVQDFILDVSCMMYDVCEKIKVIQQENAGVAAARNNGVAISNGEYVCFLDADDWWEPTWLEEMDKLIQEYPDAGLYATNYVYYKPGKTHVALNLKRGYMNYPDAYLYDLTMPVTSITTCMPRRIFDEMGGFPLGIKLGEDFLLWAKIAIKYKVAFCEKPLAYYNNDVPASLRATRNLHAPEFNMLFNLAGIEKEIGVRTASLQDATLQESWKALLDKLRVSGLMEYWLSDEYHDAAAAELTKVDWSKLPKNAKSLYEKPIWWLKAKRSIMRVGSYWKQKIIRMITK